MAKLNYSAVLSPLPPIKHSALIDSDTSHSVIAPNQNLLQQKRTIKVDSGLV